MTSSWAHNVYMDTLTSDVHRLKIGNAWAHYNATGDVIELKFSNERSLTLPFAKISSAVHVLHDVMLHFTTPVLLTNRGKKMRDNTVVQFDNSSSIVPFLASLKNNGVLCLDASDCPTLELANSAKAYMHDDAVAWRVGNSCNVCVFKEVQAVVFQRLNGGSSTFDISFITRTEVMTLEYIPCNVLANWIDYIPPWVVQYTNGPDPINVNYAKAQLENNSDIALWAPLVYDVFKVDEEGNEDEHISDDSSDYVPEDEGGSGSESESDVEFEDANDTDL